MVDKLLAERKRELKLTKNYDPDERLAAENRVKQIEKQIGLNKMTPTQRKSLRQLKRIYPVNPGSKFVMKKDEDMKPSIENKKNLTSTSVRFPVTIMFRFFNFFFRFIINLWLF